MVKDIVKVSPPSSMRRWSRRQQRRGKRFPCRFNSLANQRSLRRTIPVNPDDSGEAKGQCAVPCFSEKFLAEHTDDVRGHVPPFADYAHARSFGGSAVIASVHGGAEEDLRGRDLIHHNPDSQVLKPVRAVEPTHRSTSRQSPRGEVNIETHG